MKKIRNRTYNAMMGQNLGFFKGNAKASEPKTHSPITQRPARRRCSTIPTIATSPPVSLGFLEGALPGQNIQLLGHREHNVLEKKKIQIECILYPTSVIPSQPFRKAMAALPCTHHPLLPPVERIYHGPIFHPSLGPKPSLVAVCKGSGQRMNNNAIAFKSNTLLYLGNKTTSFNFPNK